MQSQKDEVLIFSKIAISVVPMDVDVKSANFKWSELFSILSFLKILKTAFDRIDNHKRIAMCLIFDFMRDPAKGTLTYGGCDIKEYQPQEEKKLMIDCQVVSCLFAAYANEDDISEADADVTNFWDSEEASELRFSDLIWEKELRRGSV